MRFSATLLLAIMVIANVANGESEALSQPVLNLLKYYSEHPEENWEHVSSPPEHILNAAKALHDGSIGTGSNDSEIVVILERELDLYRVIWLYIWEKADCGGYLVRTENHLLTASGEKSNARVSPAARTSGTVCLH